MSTSLEKLDRLNAPCPPDPRGPASTVFERVRRRAPATLFWVATVGGVMIFAALANPISRDEGAFIGALAVSRSASTYADFLYLQTPLQAYVARPLAAVFAGHSFIALRVIMGLLGAAILLLVYSAQRIVNVPSRRAAACAALLASCYSFQFCCGVVRNDALPALLATLALVVQLMALRRQLRPAIAWPGAGALLGLACSAKISYALLIGGVGLYLGLRVLNGRGRWRDAALFAAAAAVGLSPCAFAWVSAPDAFIFSAFEFNADVLVNWYRASGKSWLVTPAANAAVTMLILLVGPGLGALWLLISNTVSRGWRTFQDIPELGLLDFWIVSGIIAALAPTPSNFQYAMPLLPALFIRLGAEKAVRLPGVGKSQTIGLGLLGLGALIGTGYGLAVIGRGLTGDHLPVLQVTSDAQWLGAKLSCVSVRGAVATIATPAVLDSGCSLDRRFATGEFVYRSGREIGVERLAKFHAVAPVNVDSSLGAMRPEAILVGYGDGIDAPLRRFAVSHGYLKLVGPDKRYELYIAPGHFAFGGGGAGGAR